MKNKPKNRLRQCGINPQHFSKGQIGFLVYLIPVCTVMALPIVYIFMNAFKPYDELFAYPPRFFVREPTFDNFAQLFSLSSGTDIPASRYLFNSITSTLVTVFCTLLMASTAAYVFSKKKFRAKKTLFAISMMGLMFASVAVAIPRYFVVVYLGLHDNFLANIIPLLVTPTGVFLIKQFVDQRPDALVEAAVIDGATDYQIFRKIIFPLVQPALATVAIMSFKGAWNASEASSLFIDNETLKTFPFYISTLISSGGVASAGVSAAATLIMLLPNLIMFIVLQSRVMNTMAHSGIK